jgi:hypothetical protein
MNDLVIDMSKKFNLSEEQSSQIVKTVINYLKNKLPEPAAEQLNNLLITKEGKENPGNAINDLGSKFTTR